MDTANRQLRVMIPALVWAARQVIRGVLQSPLACDYSDSSGDQASDWGWMKIIHAEDLTRLMEHYRFVVASENWVRWQCDFAASVASIVAFCYGRSRCSMNPAWWNGGRQTAGNETDPSRL
jgi:hypothetical protein